MNPKMKMPLKLPSMLLPLVLMLDVKSVKTSLLPSEMPAWPLLLEEMPSKKLKKPLKKLLKEEDKENLPKKPKEPTEDTELLE